MARCIAPPMARSTGRHAAACWYERTEWSAIDPRDPARLYLAAWGRSTGEGVADGGIYLSTNRGAAWRRVLDQDQHIYDVTIDPKDARVLYAAGFELPRGGAPIAARHGNAFRASISNGRTA